MLPKLTDLNISHNNLNVYDNPSSTRLINLDISHNNIILSHEFWVKIKVFHKSLTNLNCAGNVAPENDKNA